jgi:ubiquinone/menaquinone biosynthesis C-methylase UbiE
MDNIKRNKDSHEAHELQLSYDANVFDQSFDDTKRHVWMINQVFPLLKILNPDKLLTVGDGRGREAHFLSKISNAKITASDIDDTKLSIAFKSEFISNYSKADAENLPFEDGQFDVTFAKESLHHLPRPTIGIYEMLRVSSKAAIFIEPYDAQHSPAAPYPTMREYDNFFENTENYLYRFSFREVWKLCASVQANWLIVKGFNDPWTPDFNYGVWESERRSLDLLGEEGVRQFNLMIFAVIKDPSFTLTSNENEFLRNSCFKVYRIPKGNKDLEEFLTS